MKNYSHYITIPDDIVTAVNVEDEREGYWVRYIPTKDFNDLLKKSVINFGRMGKESKSIWMQGIYGVGKSHTITVLRHLFYDDIAEIRKYTERHKDDIDPFILEDLYTMRSSKRFLPVMITGLKNITQPSELTHTLQLEIRKALQKFNITLEIKDDFQTVIESMDDNLINWDIVLNSDSLKAYVKDKEDLKQRLEEGNKQLLDKVLEYFASKNKHFSSRSLIDWVKEVQLELKKGGHADGLIIYWDEFTQFLESDAAVRVFTEFQHLAELSNKNPIYLFLVTHKTIMQLDTRISEREISKIMDRFDQASFSRAEITTYKLLRSSIKRKDDIEFITYRNNNQVDIEPVIRQIKNHSLIKSSLNDDLNHLFPFHPYTAFISAEVSRLFGSVNRTIFKFLIDDNLGFVKFLSENPKDCNQVWLLADKILDYFEDDFSKISNISGYISQYRSNAAAVLSNGPEYLVIYKIIVLLIILKEFSGNPLLTPNDMNLDNSLRGSKYYQEIGKCTAYFLEKGLIRKDLSYNYTMSTNSLPQDEIMMAESRLRDKYQNRIVTLLTESELERTAIDKLKIDSIRRPVKVKVLNSYDKTIRLNNSIEVHYAKNPQEFLVIIYVSEADNDVKVNIDQLEHFAKNYNNEQQTLILQLINTIKPSSIDKLIRYEAEANVASEHNFAKQALELTDQREHLRQTFISDIFSHQALMVLCRAELPYIKTISIPDFPDVIQEDIFKKIYHLGFENIASCQVDTIWKVRGAQSTCATDFLELSHKSKLELLRKHSKACQSIFNEVSDNRNNSFKVIGDDMSLLDLPQYHSHPLWFARQKTLDEISINKAKNRMNLGESLRFLSQPPFGYYKSSLHFAVMGFILREHYNEFLDSHDQPLSITQTKSIIEDLFNYWMTGDEKCMARLDVRFYTIEQQELFHSLIKLFKLTCHPSRKQIKWEISSDFLTFPDGKSYPLWSLKLVIENAHIADVIDEVQEFIGNSDFDVQACADLLRSITDYWIELQSVVTKDNLRIGFRRWLEKYSKNNIPTEVLEEEIRKLYPDRAEVYAWKEQQLESRILEIIDRLLHTPSEPDPQKSPLPQIGLTTPELQGEIKVEEIISIIDHDRAHFLTLIFDRLKHDQAFARIISEITSQMWD